MPDQDGIIEPLVIRPGDKLLVRVASGTTAQDAELLKIILADRFPGVEVTVIAAEQLAVVRDA